MNVDFDVPEDIRLIEVYLQPRELKELNPFKKKSQNAEIRKCRKAKKTETYEVHPEESDNEEDVNSEETAGMNSVEKMDEVVVDVADIAVSVEDDKPNVMVTDTVLLDSSQGSAKEDTEMELQLDSREDLIEIRENLKESIIKHKTDRVSKDSKENGASVPVIQTKEGQNVLHCDPARDLPSVESEIALAHGDSPSDVTLAHVSSGVGAAESDVSLVRIDSTVSGTSAQSDDSSLHTCDSDVLIKGSNESLQYSLSDIPETESHTDSSDVDYQGKNKNFMINL